MEEMVERGFDALRRIDDMIADNTEYFFGWPDMEAVADAECDEELWVDAINGCMHIMENLAMYDDVDHDMHYHPTEDGFAIIVYAYENSMFELNKYEDDDLFKLGSVAAVAARVLRRTWDYRDWK